MILLSGNNAHLCRAGRPIQLRYLFLRLFREIHGVRPRTTSEKERHVRGRHGAPSQLKCLQLRFDLGGLTFGKALSVG